jgi:hypothetical protein
MIILKLHTNSLYDTNEVINQYKRVLIKRKNTNPRIAHVRVPWACFIFPGSPAEVIHIKEPITPITITARNKTAVTPSNAKLTHLSIKSPFIGGGVALASTAARELVAKSDSKKAEKEIDLICFLIFIVTILSLL